MRQPLIMVAPNGARRTKNDHPQLPMTIEEIVEAARQCFDAGAQILHAHVRDQHGAHILDAGLYRELIAEMATKVPQMRVQITTEAVGQYSPDEQMALVRDVKPAMVSIALRELQTHEDRAALRRFYFEIAEQNIEVQHIIYAPEEIEQLHHLIGQDQIPNADLSLLFVLGRYTEGQVSDPLMFDPFHQATQRLFREDQPRIMTCAFGQAETDALVHAARCGSDLRIGFENNILMRDGRVALDNKERVTELVTLLSVVDNYQ